MTGAGKAIGARRLVSTPTSIASSLSAFVRDQAAWRRGLAQKFPDDLRNRRSADALEGLAAAVDNMRPGDAILVELAKLDIYDEAGVFHAGPSAYRLVSRYGFEGEPDVRAFLQLLLAAIAEDRKNVAAGGWSVGAANSWRFEYAKGTHVATFKSEPVDVLEVVVQASGTPEFKRTAEGVWDVVVPSHFESQTTRFRVRSGPLTSGRPFDRWVGIDELDDTPRSIAHADEAHDDRWPESELDGTDTYRWERAPREPGVAARFELTVRDAAGLSGHYFPIDGSSLVDVVVSIQDHPVPALRYVRVVRCALRPGVSTHEAPGIAVGSYIERCARQGRSPSGWALRLEPRWWRGMSFEQLALIAGDPGFVGREAQKQLLERGYFYDRLTGLWVENHPEMRIRVPSAPIKRGEPVPGSGQGPTTKLVAPPRELLAFLRRAHERRSYLRHGGKTWQIRKFSIGDPPDAMQLVEAVPAPGDDIIDFDNTESWLAMKRDDLVARRARCPTCKATVGEENGVRGSSAQGDPFVRITCPRCEYPWLVLLDR